MNRYNFLGIFFTKPGHFLGFINALKKLPQFT